MNQLPDVEEKPVETYECAVCENDYTTEEGAYECEDWDRANGLDGED